MIWAYIPYDVLKLKRLMPSNYQKTTAGMASLIILLSSNTPLYYSTQCNFALPSLKIVIEIQVIDYAVITDCSWHLSSWRAAHCFQAFVGSCSYMWSQEWRACNKWIAHILVLPPSFPIWFSVCFCVFLYDRMRFCTSSNGATANWDSIEIFCSIRTPCLKGSLDFWPVIKISEVFPRQ